MTRKNTNFIKNTDLIPDTKELLLSHCIIGPDVTDKVVHVTNIGNIINNLESILLKEVDQASMKQNTRHNIHPGSISFLLPNADFVAFLEDNIDQFLENLNSNILDKFAEHKEDIIPQFSNRVNHGQVLSMSTVTFLSNTNC